MKKSPQEYSLHSAFSLIEIIMAISLLAIIAATVVSKQNIPKLQLAVDKISLYLNYTRYIALIDEKFDIEDSEWERKRWSLKFQKCTNTNDGMYFVVYSDMSGNTAHYKKEETLRDPLNQKYLYSNYDCEPSDDESKNILLKKEYGIEKVEVSCNTTSTIGQVSFSSDGKIYSQLGTDIKEINETCTIKLFDKDDNYKTIAIEPKTGFVYQMKEIITL